MRTRVFNHIACVRNVRFVSYLIYIAGTVVSFFTYFGKVDLMSLSGSLSQAAVGSLAVRVLYGTTLT